MDIRIVQASMPGYWYKGRIGEVFHVVHVASGIGKLEVQISAEKTGYVDVVDCETVSAGDVNTTAETASRHPEIRGVEIKR